ncbi:MAG: hypothetical protein ABW169_00300 [Sphingobium sp.]
MDAPGLLEKGIGVDCVTGGNLRPFSLSIKIVEIYRPQAKFARWRGVLKFPGISNLSAKKPFPMADMRAAYSPKE